MEVKCRPGDCQEDYQLNVRNYYSFQGIHWSVCERSAIGGHAKHYLSINSSEPLDSNHGRSEKEALFRTFSAA
jgi:hypothetical protein